MNILWISHNVPYPPKTGVLQRNFNLLKETSRIGNIYLIAFYQKDILPIQYDMVEARKELEKICSYVEIFQIPTDTYKLKWYGLVLRSIFTADPYSVNWLKSRQMRLKIQQLVTRIKFDVVHFDTIGLAEYRNDVGVVPKILNHHNIESKLMERRSFIEKNILKKMYFKIEARKLKRYEMDHCNKFDFNVTVSDLDKALLCGVVPGCRIDVIPNGVDTDYFCPGNGAFIKRNLIFVGGMNWYPNRDAVIYLRNEIWPLLKKEILDVSLTVVGARPPKELLDLRKSDDKVRVTGFVDDVRPYLRSAEVYICPIRDGGGTRLKILDALAMGKAIVSTTIGCEGIDVEHGKNVLIADTPVEFTAQVKRVIEDPQLREMLGREGRRLVEAKYSWKVIGKALGHIYKSLLTSKKRNAGLVY